MIEAMYGIEFESNANGGTGVVIFETGKILGGDSSFVYIGTYTIENGILKARIEANNDRKILESIIGLDHFHLIGELNLGKGFNRNAFQMIATVVERPGVKIVINFTWRAELP